MENFVLYEEICNVDGQTIYKARRKGTITFLAICCIDKNRRIHATNHVRFAHGFDHQNILKFHEWYETSNHLWLVMDLCTGGTLERMLREDRLFPESAIVDIGRQLICGLYFIQSTGVVFADWSPNRIFLDGCGSVKYFDFSYARLEHERSADIFLEGVDSELVFDGLSSASLSFIAPEILAGDIASKSSDVWGLGCILFKMLFGVTPFSTQVPAHLIQMIRNNEIEIPIQCCRKPSDDLWQLIRSMLVKDPRKRITLQEVMEHNFWQINPPMSDPLRSNHTDEDAASLTNSIVTVATAIQSSKCEKHEGREISLKPKGEQNAQVKKAQVKRSVSVGDNAVDSNALLKKQLNTRKASLEQTSKPGVQPIATKPHEVPVGEANFTLHAQAYPVTVRRKPTEPRYDQNNKTVKTTTSSNDESMDTSSRCESKLSANSDSGQTTMYESQDSLNPPMSPISIDGRMTKSDFVFRDSDPSRPTSAKLRRSPLSGKVAALLSPQARARIALIYPWGDDAPLFPRDTRISKTQPACGWEDLLSSDDMEDLGSTLSHAHGDADGKQKASPSWLPRPLNEYDAWIKSPPKGDIHLPGGMDPLTLDVLDTLHADDINEHAKYVLETFTTLNSPRQSKSRPSSSLVYAAWFLAATTLTHTKGDSKRQDFEANFTAFVFRTKSNFSEAAALLRQNLPSNNARSWLCRIVGLLAFRTSFMVRYYCEHPIRQIHLHTLVREIAPELPLVLSAIVDVLREPASKNIFSLKQAGIIALGELLVCEISIYGLVLSDPGRFSDPCLEGIDVSKAQWQSAVLQLIRALATTNTASRVTQQPEALVPSAFCGFSTKSNEPKASSTTVLVRVVDEHVRLAAARALDEVVVAIIGCKLSPLLQSIDRQDMERTHPNVKLTISICVSVSAFLECLLISENVSRVWADGVMGGGGSELKGGVPARSGSALPSKNLVNQKVAHASSSALAGLIRLRPALFTCGLIDRNGATALIQKFNPASETRETQSTAIMAHLLSATATGLLLPLSFRGKPPVTFLQTGLKSGTPAACRRLLHTPRFVSALTRQFESPHVMLRAKAYLIAAAALESSSEVLVTVCEARLASCLERDLRMTNQHYTPKTPLDEDGVLIGSDDDVKTGGPNGDICSTTIAAAPGLQYLGVCVKHLSDFIVYSLIPNICKHVAISIGANSSSSVGKAAKGASPAAQSNPSKMMTSSTYQERSGRNISSAGSVRRSPFSLDGSAGGSAGTRTRPLGSASGAVSSSNSPGVSLKTWLPAFACLPGILASSASIRNSLLLPDSTDGDVGRHFCLIEFIGKILLHWASNNHVTTLASTSAGVHQSGSLEHQLLVVALTLTEDMSQEVDVVEGRRADLIKSVLPGLAKLAVAPASDPLTRTICVKIILDMKNIWCGDTSEDEGLGISMTTSNISLHNLRSSGRSISGRSKNDGYPSVGGGSLIRSPLSSDRLNNLDHRGGSKFTNIERTVSLRGEPSAIVKKRPLSSLSPAVPTRSSSTRLSNVAASNTRPRSVYGSKSTINSNRLNGGGVGKTCNMRPNLRTAGVQGPPPEVLEGVIEIVNNLLIPYASLLLDPRDPSPSPYFLRLVWDCLLLFQTASTFSTTSPCSSSLSLADLPSPTRVHNAPATLVTVNPSLPVSIIRLLAGVSGGGGRDGGNPPGSQRFSTHCLLGMRLLYTLLSQWPRETDILQLILNTSERRQSLVSVASGLVVSIGGSILRHGRRDSQSHCFSPELATESFFPTTTKPPANHRATARSATPKMMYRRDSSPTCVASLQHLKVTSETPGLRHLFAALDLLNIALDFVANVVRCALQCRGGKSSRPSSAKSKKDAFDMTRLLPCDPEEICILAEQLLATARPPNHLPGILASLLEASPPSPTDSADPSTSTHHHHHTNSLTASDLVECATSALANLASLYGGEYCRTALSAAGLRGFALAIRRSSSSTKMTTAAAAKDSADTGDSENRAGTRLLLRILRRLSESDEMCSRRMMGPAAKHLQTAIWRLRGAGGGEENQQHQQDGATVRLAGALLERLNSHIDKNGDTGGGRRHSGAVAI